ncbi:MAG: hypothetical protein AAFU65_05050 [Pseudomonadota bacterium]
MPHATPAAHAAWQEASTDHFVIYADASAADVRHKAEQLERVHDAFVDLFGLPNTVPSPSNRLTVFVLKDVAQVNLYFNHPSRSVAGFFVGQSGGSVAYVPSGRDDDTVVRRADEVLLHEYAHFLMWGKQSRVLPPWFSEGAAEFAGSLRIAGGSDGDETLSIGAQTEQHARRVAAHRALSLKAVLAARSVGDIRPDQLGGFYGKSFLLYHFLSFQPDGPRTLDTYLELLSNGASMREAAEQAFGDIDDLSAGLDDYAARTALPVRDIPNDGLIPGQITLRKLPRAEARAMPYRMWLMRGVGPEQAEELLPALAAHASKNASDDSVLATLAAMQYAARKDDEALATAERVITRNPDHFKANLVKMMAMHRGVGRAENRPEAWKAARRQIVLTNRLETDHPLPLRLYYAGVRGMHLMYGGPAPTGEAFTGMRRALELAPYDDKLRVWVGSALVQAGRLEEARFTFLPLATDLHGSAYRENALKALAEIDKRLDEEAAEGRQ